jgi:hypothetical protein
VPRVTVTPHAGRPPAVKRAVLDRHQDSEYAVSEHGARSLAVVTCVRPHREPAGQWCGRLRHGLLPRTSGSLRCEPPLANSEIGRMVDLGLSRAPGASEKTRRPDALLGESRALLQLLKTARANRSKSTRDTLWRGLCVFRDPAPATAAKEKVIEGAG